MINKNIYRVLRVSPAADCDALLTSITSIFEIQAPDTNPFRVTTKALSGDELVEIVISIGSTMVLFQLALAIKGWLQSKANRTVIVDGTTLRGFSADEIVEILGRTKEKAPTVRQGEDELASGRRVKILFLAANPEGPNRLRLDEEVRAISGKIRASEHRELLELESAWAVQPEDLLQTLNWYKPHIVHFSGHGIAAGDILLVDYAGNPSPVSSDAIVALFRSATDNIRLVVLNACYSKTLARSITEVIDCVVGMNVEISDDSARVFAAALYSAIGFGRSVQQAFDQAVTALRLESRAETEIPVLVVRPGIEASALFMLDSLIPKSSNPL